MITITLIRHGQKLPHSGNPGLTDLGKLQARETGEYLKQFPINKIIASPFKRTVETAQEIARVLNREYSLHPALVERMNWNDDSITKQQFLKEWIVSTNNRTYQPLYGDSSFATGQRIELLVREIAKDGDHIVLVTHGGAILDYLRNLFSDEAFTKLRMRYDEGDDYQMFNGAINTLSLGDAPKLLRLNFVDHLTSRTE